MSPKKASISYFDKFYDVTAHFSHRFDKLGRQMAFSGKTARDVLLWRSKLKTKLSSLLGLDTFDVGALRPRLRGKKDMGSYWREDWTIHTEPDVIAPFYMLIPKNLKGNPRPVVICPHGHVSAGRFSSAGRTDIECVAELIKRFNFDYAAKLCERGFVTFAIDARGFGQRRVQNMQRDKELPSRFIHGSCHQLMLMGQPLGQSVAGMWVWDLMRLIDYIGTRKECDGENIGCAGLSGGGLQTLFLAAIDERIKASVVSGYFYGVKESLIQVASHCDCNSIPHLWEYADMGDIGGLIAPSGLFVETGNEDPLNGKNGLKNVYSQLKIARRSFRAAQCETQLVHHAFQGKHQWCGRRAIPWLSNQLGLAREQNKKIERGMAELRKFPTA